MKYAFIINKGVFHRSSAKVYPYSVFFFHICKVMLDTYFLILENHTLSAQIGELQAHCPSRWRART